VSIVARRYVAGRESEEPVEVVPGMADRLRDDEVLWIRADPDDAALRRIDAALCLDGVVAATADVERPGARYLKDAIRLSVFGMEHHPDAGEPRAVLVHLIAVPNAVVMVAPAAIGGIEDAVDAHAGDPRFGALDAGTFLGLLLDGILDGYHRELEAIERDVDRVDEAALRKEPVEALLLTLVSIRRRSAVLRRSLAPQRAVYETLARPIGGQGSPIGAPWPELIDRLEHTIDAVERAHDLLLGSFDIVMTRTGQRTNDIMRVLTVISSVLLPSVVIAGVMGMNFHPDFFDQPSLFWIVLALMGALAAISLGVARMRRWI
jgi:Mg2+ and Co2+ transporter CorA